MTINKKQTGSAIEMALEGRLDTSTAPELENALNECTDMKSLVLDFSGLEYISSAGLRVLLQAQKKLSALDGLKLTNVNDTIKEVFDITGFADILTIE